MALKSEMEAKMGTQKCPNTDICICQEIGPELDHENSLIDTKMDNKSGADRLRAKCRREIREKGIKEYYSDTETRHLEKMFRIGMSNFKMGENVLSWSKTDQNAVKALKKYMAQDKRRELCLEYTGCERFQDSLRELQFLLEKPHPKLHAPATIHEAESYFHEYMIPLRIVMDNYYPEEAMETLEELYASMVSRLSMLKCFVQVRSRGCRVPPENHFLAMDRKLLFLYHLLKVPLGREREDYHFLSRLGLKLLFKLRTLKDDYYFLPDVVGITVRAFSARLEMYRVVNFTCMDHLLLPQFILLTSQKYITQSALKIMGCPNCFVKPTPVDEKEAGCRCESRERKRIWRMKRLVDVCPIHQEQSGDGASSPQKRKGDGGGKREEEEARCNGAEDEEGSHHGFEDDEDSHCDWEDEDGESTDEEGCECELENVDSDEHNCFPEDDAGHRPLCPDQSSVASEEEEESEKDNISREICPDRNVLNLFKMLKLSGSRRVCDGCGRGQDEVTLKVCGDCEEDNLRWAERRYYCGNACKAKDWKERHQEEHRAAISMSNQRLVYTQSEGPVEELD